MPQFLISESFWTAASAIAALIALVLSQFPPIRTYFGNKKPLLTTAPTLGISHYLGAPNIQLYINIENESPKPLKVKKISMMVERYGEQAVELQAYTVFEKIDSNIQKIFTPFTIRPETDWGNNISFYTPFVGDKEQKIKEIQYNIRNSINKKRDYRQATDKNNLNVTNQLLIADDSYVTDALEFYNENRFWETRDYSIKLKIITDSPETSVELDFTFFLNSIENNELDIIADRYKYGATLMFPDSNAWVFPWIRKPK
jgi:hypothetical protein